MSYQCTGMRKLGDVEEERALTPRVSEMLVEIKVVRLLGSPTKIGKL
jgi:hypothetical protein